MFKTSQPDLNVFASVVRGPVAVGRFLLVVATISLLTMPLTQHFWTWDHFLRGGQDFESGMLVIVSILCLAVLLSQLCKKDVDLFFIVRRLLDSMRNPRELAGMPLKRASFFFPITESDGAAIGVYNHPLKI